MWSQPVKTTPAVETGEAVFYIQTVGSQDAPAEVGRVTVSSGAEAVWIYLIPEDGDYDLTATPVDAAGNVGPASPPLRIHLDHLAPAAFGALIVTSTAAWTP